jgi:hypothetical protein
MPDRSDWADAVLDREIAAIWRAIDDLPNRMTQREAAALAAYEWSKRLEKQIEQLSKDFANSRQGLTRPEKIALFGSSAGFLGAAAAALALFLGGG